MSKFINFSSKIIVKNNGRSRLKGASLGQAPALPSSIQLGLKGLSGPTLQININIYKLW
jgi:hypothetical protein